MRIQRNENPRYGLYTGSPSGRSSPALPTSPPLRLPLTHISPPEPLHRRWLMDSELTLVARSPTSLLPSPTSTASSPSSPGPSPTSPQESLEVDTQRLVRGSGFAGSIRASMRGTFGLFLRYICSSGLPILWVLTSSFLLSDKAKLFLLECKVQ
jgi:hypothetical protein